MSNTSSSNSTSDNSTSDTQGDVNFNSLAISLIFAFAVNWGLQGMLCLQVYTYYLAFPRDGLRAKLQVYAVLIFELFQSAVVAHDVVIALAPSMSGAFDHDLVNSLNSLHTQWFSIPLAGGIIGGVGQLFFAYRIWMISNEKGPPIAIGILSIGSICAALVSTASFFSAKTFSYLLRENATDGFASITAWNGIGAICDISIALSMPYFLMRRGTGLPSTHLFIVRLVRLLIETGGLTAIMAILHTCLYVSHSESFVIPGLCMSKIYSTTMLVIFNNRVKILGGRFDQEVEDDPSFTASRVVSRERRESRDSRTTKILVSNRRLTFQLADLPVPSSPSVEITSQEISPSSNSVTNTIEDLEA